jgi:hypothetical protein
LPRRQSPAGSGVRYGPRRPATSLSRHLHLRQQPGLDDRAAIPRR